MNPYIEILRPFNWIKNVIMFIPLFLSLNLFNVSLYPSFIITFVVLCLFSSAGYIVNDMTGYGEDSRNPLKCNKVLVSRRISLRSADLFACFLTGIGGSIMYLGSFYFNTMTIIILLPLVIDTVYSYLMRSHKVMDVAFISFKYPLRLLIGYALIGVYPDIYLMMSLYFLSGIMVIMKRKGEKVGLGDKGIPVRHVLMDYTHEILNNLFIVYYALFSFFILRFHILQEYFILIPVIIILLSMILAFYSNINYEKSKSLAIVKDKSILILIIIYGLLFFYILYGEGFNWISLV